LARLASALRARPKDHKIAGADLNRRIVRWRAKSAPTDGRVAQLSNINNILNKIH
jgi:hypothetical protein